MITEQKNLTVLEYATAAVTTHGGEGAEGSEGESELRAGVGSA